MKIGVLALQGNFASHAQLVERIGAQPILVKTALQLDGVDGLIIPGGEQLDE
jgi:5'-phosphate synthase pdxT subunit